MKNYTFIRTAIAFFALLGSISMVSAYTVTGLQATCSNGQTFLTWNNPASTNLQYNLYRSATQITSSSQLTADKLMGFVRDNSGKNVHLSIIENQDIYFKITDDGQPLASNKGLYVVTCTDNQSYYYAVTVTTLSDNIESKTINAGENSLTTAVIETVEKPQPVFQDSVIIIGDEVKYDYVQFGNNQETPLYPALNSTGSYGFNFYIGRRGNTTSYPLFVVVGNGGVPNSGLGLEDYYTDCYVLGVNDWLPIPDGSGGIGGDAKYCCYHENFNIYKNNNPIPTSGIVKTYPVRRYIEAIRWAKNHFPIDGTRVYTKGNSQAGHGALLIAAVIPEEITCVYAQCEPLSLVTQSVSILKQMWGVKSSNLNTDVLDWRTGLPLSFTKLTDLKDMVNVNEQRPSVPLIFDVHGKNDVTVLWAPPKVEWLDSLEANHVGGVFYWDQRVHGGTGQNFLNTETQPDFLRYSTDKSYPAFSNCSINQNPGNGTPTNGDPYGAINGYLDWKDSTIVDNTAIYAITCLVKNMYANGVLMTEHDSCTTDITFRRMQHFKPTIGQLVYWQVQRNNGAVVQEGSFTYTNTAPITLHGIKIYKTNSIITLTTLDCSILYYPDADNDGFGSASNPGTAYCTPPAGYITNHTDCNDANASIHPGGQEICDANDLDEDCDGLTDDVDPSVTGKTMYYADADLDGYGSPASQGTAYCNPPAGVSPVNTDCDDGNAGTHPGAADNCNGIDDNCNSVIDENAITVSISPSGSVTGCKNDPLTFTSSGTNITNYQWYKNYFPVSGETNSTWNTVFDSCSVKVMVSNNFGCSAFSDVTTINTMNKPSSTITILNGGNLDLCSGNVSFTTTQGSGYSRQWNKDGIAIPGSTDVNYDAAEPGSYTVTITNISTGCSKTSAAVVVLGPFLCYADADQDGYGASSDPGLTFCIVPPGYVTSNTDCDDLNAAINPAANEVCDANGIDEDCDGLSDNADPSALGKIIYYPDADNDGYGSASSPGTAYCVAPAGWLTDHSDCNDANASIHPNGTELCDPNDEDEDCDGLVDDADPSATAKTLYYTDADNDGYGSLSASGIAYCNPPAGNAPNNTDCNDANASIHPNGTEICDANDVDEDCDGLADDSDPSATGKVMFYIDADGDGYGSSSIPGTGYCNSPAGKVTNNADCADGNAAVNPAATEICDGIDNDCDGLIDEFMITSNPMPAPVITPVGSTSFCYDQTVTLNATTGYNQYTWSNGKSGQSITANTNGPITVTVKDGNNCYGTSPPVSLTVWDLPVPVVSCLGPTTYCIENPSTLTTIAGYSYQWKKGANVLTGATNQTYVAISTSANYKVTMNEAHGCSRTSGNFSVTVNSAPKPILTVAGGTSICQGQSCTITATAGYSSYLWSSGQTTSSISVSAAGNYSVTGTHANGCIATSDPKTITVNSLPQPVITPLGVTSFCDGGSVTLDAGAGYSSYSWSNGKNTQTISVTASGTFTVTVTNSNGCAGTSVPVTVTEWIPPTPTISTSTGGTTFCSNAGVYLTTLAGYNYQWQKSNVNISGATTQNYFPTSGGSYKVTITDSHGCSKTSTALSVTINMAPSPAISGSGTICSGSSVTLSCGTFSAYTWSTGSHAATINVNSAGNYTVTVTDGNGCSGTSPVKTTTVVPLPAPAISAQGPIQFCDGGSVTLDAGNGYSSYSWSNAKNTQTISVTASGTFTVTVTNANGCAGTSAPLTVTEWIPPTPNVTTSTGATTFCSNSGVYLTTLSGYSYQWLKGSTVLPGATSQNYTPSSGGSYKVTITDSHGCSKTSTGLSVIVSTAPIASITITGSANICTGQTKTITANTGSGLTYKWKRDGNIIGGATTSSYVASVAGDYTCVVTNTSGCSTTSNTITITSNCKDETESLKNFSWQIYPNPASSELHIRFSTGYIESGIYTGEIRNMLGSTIWRKESSFTDYSVAEDLTMNNTLSSGVYFVIIYLDGKAYSSQFILSKE